MQESRLFRIVYYLLDKGKTTAPKLSENLKCLSEQYTVI